MQWKLAGVYKGDLMKMQSNGNMEPELAIFCNQARVPVDGLGH